MNPIELKILLFPANNTVQVTAPLGNVILCLGMLEAAKHKILTFDPAKVQEHRGVELVENGEVRPKP